jgi:hypothetical protein
MVIVHFVCTVLVELILARLHQMQRWAHGRELHQLLVLLVMLSDFEGT